MIPLGGTGGGCPPEAPVSIWRTYFVANEWNEIQTVRKINPIFQYFAAVFFLSVVGFGNVATMDPVNHFDASDGVEYRAPMSNILRFACIGVVYLTVGQLSMSFVLTFTNNSLMGLIICTFLFHHNVITTEAAAAATHATSAVQAQVSL